MNELRKIRQYMDKLLSLDNAELHQIHNDTNIEMLNNPTLYAWYPTLTCPSELGTTSDQCSSNCGVGRCSSKTIDKEIKNESDNIMISELIIDELNPSIAKANTDVFELVSTIRNPF